jgi:cellulose synthase/poly-beta-1,6-N-acetylglucosamine synthase-like glycosyltransferase
MASLFFWSASLLLVHTYFLYPLMLIGLDRIARRRTSSARGREEDLPSVSLVVAAYNEVSCIESKVKNSLALDYPRDRFQLIVGSDGSNDGTDEVVARERDPRVLLSPGPRGGKTSVLNRCVPIASGEIVVLTDANTRLDEQALRELVRPFADPEVGAVCGKLRLFNPTQPEFEESAYWSYESMIKQYEGRHGAVMGANGGLYAIRRRLFTLLPPSTIVDDFVIPLRILEHGYQVVYAPEAIAYEETTEDYGREFGRRARIAAGNFQSLQLLPGLLSPLAGFPAFAFWSHKLLRWIAPALMLLALISNALLLDRPFYQATFAAQLGFYALAFAGRRAWFGGTLRRAASVAYYFVTMNAAIAVGFWRFVRQTQRPAWERTARVAS